MTPDQRRFDIDALRVLAFGLLILYHVGMFYVADWDWHIKSAYTAEWLQEPMRFTNQWRMSLLFVISGLATSFVIRRYRPWVLAGRRALRLGLPLIFGMAVVVAPQPYFEALGKNIIEPGFLSFWGQYLTFHDFPGEAWGGENNIVWTWNHLWYLPYVLLYTLVTLPLIALVARDGREGWAPFQRLRGVALILVPLIPLQLYGTFVFPHWPYINHGLLNDVYAHALYGTLFLYGAFMGRDPAFWRNLAQRRRLFLSVAVVSYAALRAQEVWVPEDPSGLVNQ
ncbi:MAG: acyltransferase family protein, partial [Pseudomonadota bacterium]